MRTAIYAITRLMLCGFGWSVAAVAALLAEMLMQGLLWPLFTVIAGWWTFACAVYVESEGSAASHSDRPAA